MERFLWNLFSFAAVFCGGWFLYRLTIPFVSVRKRPWNLLLYCTLCGTSGMVIWIGDPNLLYTLPVFLALFFLCTQGSAVGRLAMTMILFCLIMSVSALADTYVLDCFAAARWGKLAAILLRPLLLGTVYLVFLPRLPREPVSLSPRLWKLVLGLAAMPLCSLAAVVLLTGGRYDSAAVLRLSLTMGLAVLPVVLLTSAALLAAILVLAQHEALEQSRRLASLREIYYQGLQQQERQVRQLRHDLRNHLTALLGLLEREDTEAAKAYAAQLSRQDALQGTTRFCDNEIANVVLSAKSAELKRAGIPAEFSVSLPAALPVADTDLCALLGNAMDNAREGAQGCPSPWVHLRCRMEKGLWMLQVENSVSGPVPADLSTTKSDKAAHGFGLPGMGEIARRYGGTLEAGCQKDVFRLLVCVPVGAPSQ